MAGRARHRDAAHGESVMALVLGALVVRAVNVL